MISEYSRTGKYHIGKNRGNEDSICFEENKSCCVISLADGVSSCKKAKSGALEASREIADLFLEKGSFLEEFGEKEISELVLSRITRKLCRKAEKESFKAEDYSSTVASVFADMENGKILCFNLGDGMVLASGKGRTGIVSMPCENSAGCCVTTTKNASEGATVKYFEVKNFDSFVICSDGAWKKMFEKGRLLPEVEKILKNSEYDKLKKFLDEKECFDDCSFVSLIFDEKTGG